MKTDGLFKVHQVEYALSPNTPLRILIFGDVHRDSPLHASDRWSEFLECAKEAKQQGALFLGMGDYFDSYSTSERTILSNPGLHESTKKNWEIAAAERVKEFAEELSFMRGSIIGLIGGNHAFWFSDGTSSDQMLCRELGADYLGVCAFVRIHFTSDNEHHSNHKFDMFLHHGAGAARLVGGSLNRVDQMHEVADADFYCMGHDHKRGVYPCNPRLYPVVCNGKLTMKERRAFAGRSGSFLKAYQDGEVSYNVDAARGACNLGHIELEIVMRRSRDGGTDTSRLDVRGIS